MKNIKEFNYKILIESPGRVNLIGEHIDYNGGYVLPGATDLFIQFTFSNSKKNYSEVYSSVLDKKCKIYFDNLSKREIQWENYLVGSLISISKKRKVELENFNPSENCVFMKYLLSLWVKPGPDLHLHIFIFYFFLFSLPLLTDQRPVG